MKSRDVNSILTAATIVKRATKPNLIEYLNTLIDMTILPSKIYKRLAHQSDSQESNPPYFMLSLFLSDQKLMLWRPKIAITTHGGISLLLTAGFHYGNLGLHPRFAKFLGSEQFYVDFEEPRLRIYYLAKFNLYPTHPDELADDYEYELSFEDSQLALRSLNFGENEGEEGELTFDVNFPQGTKAEWRVFFFEGGTIMCIESKSNTLVLLNIGDGSEKSLCKVIILERDVKDTLLTDIWISPQVKKGIRKIYFIDNLFNIYLLKVDSEWNNKSMTLAKMVLKHVFDSSKFPELNQQSHLRKRHEFFSWTKRSTNILKPEKNVDACIMFTLKRFYFIELESEPVQERIIEVPLNPYLVMVSGWTVFNNFLIFGDWTGIYDVNLLLDCDFGTPVKSITFEDSVYNSQLYFLKLDNFIVAVILPGVKFDHIQLMFYDIFHYRVEVDNEGIRSAANQSNQIAEMEDDEIDFGNFFDDYNDIADRRKPKSRTESALTTTQIRPFYKLKVNVAKINNPDDFTFDSKIRIEVKDSVIFLRGYMCVSFVDILRKYNLPEFTKRGDIHKLLSSNDSTAFTAEKPKKLNLINYQELTPNPNAADRITEKVIERTLPSKTALKKNLKGLNKSQKLEKLKELTMDQKVKNHEEVKDLEEESNEPRSEESKASEISRSNAKKTLEKMSKLKRTEERREKGKKNDQRIKTETFRKYFGGS